MIFSIDLKRWCGAALVAIALLATPAMLRADDRDDARTALAKGKALEAKGDLRGARIELMNAIQADPQWADARIVQAEIFLALFDAAAAQAEIDRAIELGATDDQVRHLRGHALLLQGDALGARDTLTTGGYTRAGRPYGMRILGNAEQMLGNRQQAAAVFDAALRDYPQDSMLWADVARFRFAGGEQEGAVQAIDRAVQLDPRNVRALQFRAELLRDQFGLASAIPWFEQALRIAPNDVAVLTEYAATLGDMGQAKKMLATTRKILDIEPGNARALFMQAVMAARAGDYELARKVLNRTGGSLAETPSGLLLEGILEYQASNWNAAVDRFDRLLEMQPDNHRAQELLARALEKRGNYDDVVARFGWLAARADCSPYVLTILGRAQEQLGRRDLAGPLLDRAALPFLPRSSPSHGGNDSLATLASNAAFDPGNAGAVIPYIRALMGTGDLARALEAATRLRDANPGAPDAHMLVGDVQLVAGEPQAALEAYRAASRVRFSEQLLVRMVTAHRRMNQYREAGELITFYLNQNPANLTASRMLAMAYMDVEAWGYAVKLLREARSRIGPHDAVLLADLAYAELQDGQTQAGLATATAAYRVQPANPVVTHVLGLAALENGKRDQAALALLEKARVLMPENPMVLTDLARAYARTGRKSAARSLVDQALAMGDFPRREAAVRLRRTL